MNYLLPLFAQSANGTTENAVPISIGMSILYVYIGILVSLILPVAVGLLKKAGGGLEGAEPEPTFSQRVTSAFKCYAVKVLPYIGAVFAGGIVAAVIVMMLALQFTSMREALLAGFAWESFVNKLFASQKGNGS